MEDGYLGSAGLQVSARGYERTFSAGMWTSKDDKIANGSSYSSPKKSEKILDKMFPLCI